MDSKKLEKAEAKIQQKQEKRQENGKGTQVSAVKLQTATASQVINKKDTKLESRNVNRNMDIRIENFDLAFGEKYSNNRTKLCMIF